MNKHILLLLTICLAIGSCKTYHLSPSDFRTQLLTAPHITQARAGNDYCAVTIISTRGTEQAALSALAVLTKDGNPFMMYTPANTEVRVTTRDGKRKKMYMHDLQVSDSSFIAVHSSLLKINRKPIFWNDLTYIEIQVGGKREGNYAQR